MTFELIMLLGFFGTALLALLPKNPKQVASEHLRRQRCQRGRASRKQAGRDNNNVRLTQRETRIQKRNIPGTAA